MDFGFFAMMNQPFSLHHQPYNIIPGQVSEAIGQGRSPYCTASEYNCFSSFGALRIEVKLSQSDGAGGFPTSSELGPIRHGTVGRLHIDIVMYSQ